MKQTQTGGSPQRGQPADEKKIVAKVSVVTILGNAVLSGLKLIAGIVGHSGAMVSDAVHSLSDVFTTIIAYLGVRISNQAPDREHPYGHERLECVAAVFLGLTLLITGGCIGWTGIQKVLAGHYDQLAVPGAIALAAAVISIVTKEAMYRYTLYYADQINSDAFRADAWHHRSDALSSIGSLIGIGGAMLGFPVLDPIASVAISLCIIKVSYDILKDAIGKMLDTSCGEEYEKALNEFISAQRGVDHIDLLQTRQFGNKVYIDCEISADGSLSLEEAHAIAEHVHLGVEKNFANVKHIMIHVNPTGEDEK